tara:strand:- start:523 stop:1317 length:795 start_codon:yes stop_codon:yes gene_type:complete
MSKSISKGRKKRRSRSRRRAGIFLKELGKQRLNNIEEKKDDMKRVDQWKGNVSIYGKNVKVHIEIFKPKHKNYYISITPCQLSKCVFGPLTNVIKMPPQETEWKKGKGEVPRKHLMYRVSINYTKTGSYQGGPVHSYQEHLCMFSKNKKTIDSLTTFLSKYSKKVTDKNKKTKKKGGSKRTRRKKDPYKVTTKSQKDFMKACKKAEKHKDVNVDKRNFDCETMIYNNNMGETSNKRLKFMTSWYKDSIKNKKLDWDKYDKYKFR